MGQHVILNFWKNQQYWAEKKKHYRRQCPDWCLHFLGSEDFTRKALINSSLSLF